MNTRIEVGPMAISLAATIMVAGVKVQNVCCQTNNVLSWVYFNSPTISINGHSLKSINPELKVGELATSMA